MSTTPFKPRIKVPVIDTDGSGPIDAQVLADYDYYLRKARESLIFRMRPWDTTITFLKALYAFTSYSIRVIVYHPGFRFGFIPILSLYIGLLWFPGAHTATLKEIEFWIEYGTWWVGLGILSSIGMGTGLQSGVLFLFPHIVKVCLAAQTCGTTEFDSTSDIWFRQPPGLFKCPPELPGHQYTPTTFWGMWWKIIGVCFLQAAGTAIGEIPPYAMSKASRLAAIEAGDDKSTGDDLMGSGSKDNNSYLPEELDQDIYSDPKDSVTGMGLTVRLYNAFKQWMIRFLRKHGFVGVLALASWPNIAFDLCGVFCGHYLMPFWKFFIATLIGKSIIRNGYQSIIYVSFCSENYFDKVVVSLQAIVPDWIGLDKAIQDGIGGLRNSFRESATIAHQKSTASLTLPEGVWASVMVIMLGLFLGSCIEQCVQYYQFTVDRKELQEMAANLPENERGCVITPSGKLHLPKPSAKVRRELKSPTYRQMSPGKSPIPLSPNSRSPLSYSPSAKYSRGSSSDRGRGRGRGANNANNSSDISESEWDTVEGQVNYSLISPESCATPNGALLSDRSLALEPESKNSTPIVS
jgi:vacuole membrane protein 1